MKTSELRIGNIVSYLHLVEDSATLIDEVTAIDYFGVSLKSLHGGSIRVNDDSLCVKPLELTEDWLIKFGFKKGKLNEMYNHNGNQFHYEWRLPDYYGFDIIQHTGNYIDYTQNEFTCFVCLSFIALKYVHQLQNLYFALTGQELTIK